MEPYAAVLYPNQWIRSTNFFKAALLLWDHVDVIAPNGKLPGYTDKRHARAADILLRIRIPTEEEKNDAHSRISALAEAGLPADFYFAGSNGPDASGAYTQMDYRKLSNLTWRKLQDVGLVTDPSTIFSRLDNSTELRHKGRRLPYRMSAKFGLIAMAILAKVCAGATKSTITDDAETYTCLIRESSIAEDFGSVPRYEQLVNITLKVLRPDEATLGSIVSLREREERKGGTLLRQLRRNYHKAIFDRIGYLKEARNSADLVEIDRVFEQEMRDDLRQLREELNLAADSLLFSSAAFGAVAVLVGALINPTDGAIITLAGARTFFDLLQSCLTVSQSRRKILAEHPMSYLIASKEVESRTDLFSRTLV